MSGDDELFHQIMQTRYDFAAAVMACHKTGFNDDDILDRMGECERAYIEVVIMHASPGFVAALARQERGIDQLRKLAAIPPEGTA